MPVIKHQNPFSQPLKWYEKNHGVLGNPRFDVDVFECEQRFFLADQPLTLLFNQFAAPGRSAKFKINGAIQGDYWTTIICANRFYSGNKNKKWYPKIVTPVLLPSQWPSQWPAWEILYHVSRLHILLGARACGGEDGHLARFDGRLLALSRRLLAWRHMAFGGLVLPSPTSTTSYMCQNVTFWGVASCF